MQSTRSPLSRAVTSLIGAGAVIAALVLFVSGCASTEDHVGRSGGRGRAAQPRLAESTTFFDGALTADVSLEPITFLKSGDDREGRAGRPGGGRSRRNHGGGYPDDGPREDRFYGADSRNESRDEPTGGRIPLGPPPSMELRAKFTNNSEAAIEFEVPDFASALGNYAVRPEKLTLAPHASAELDPMPAVYPDTVTELTVNIRVRAIGKSDTKSVTLHAVPATSPTSAK